ncbi:DUF5958 family protein [Pseudoduganella sp. HUAS MS19]
MPFELQINRITQDQVSKADCCSWFDSQKPEKQVQILRVLAKLCWQASPLAEEAPQAILNSTLYERLYEPLLAAPL